MTALSEINNNTGNYDKKNFRPNVPPPLTTAELYNLVYFNRDFKLLVAEVGTAIDRKTFIISVSHRELISILVGGGNLKFSIAEEGSARQPDISVTKTELTSSLVKIVLSANLVPGLLSALQDPVKLLLSKRRLFKARSQLDALGITEATVTSNGYLVMVSPKEILGLVGREPGYDEWKFNNYPLKSKPEGNSDGKRKTGNNQSRITKIPIFVEEKENKLEHQEVKQRIRLTKGRVSEIIGRRGENIERLRKESNCRIKVMDIPVDEYEINLFQPKSKKPQDIVISGSASDVANLVNALNKLK